MEESQEEEYNSGTNLIFKLIMIAILYFLYNKEIKYQHQFYPYFKRAIFFKNILDLNLKEILT